MAYLQTLTVRYAGASLTVAFAEAGEEQDSPETAVAAVYREALNYLRAAVDVTAQAAATAPAAAPTNQPPRTPTEAEARFFARYGQHAGMPWRAVSRWLGTPMPKPHTVEEWMHAALLVRDPCNARAAAA